MSPERWREIEQLFDLVADRPASEQAALLDSADPEVRAEVEKLLASDGQGAPCCSTWWPKASRCSTRSPSSASALTA
jgi:hypothetical protein